MVVGEQSKYTNVSEIFPLSNSGKERDKKKILKMYIQQKFKSEKEVGERGRGHERERVGGG